MLFIVACSVSGDLTTHALTVWILVPALWFDWKKFYFLDLLIGRRDTTVPVAFGGSTSRMYPSLAIAPLAVYLIPQTSYMHKSDMV